ncbi:peptidoglycan-associated lipoprotein Pal [Geminicoccaceae bacterium 1502E]|nr:peptidoglycan-associated lipoprotein Pal [Geminicoccaceae bacterium 1502E]
MKLKLLSMGAAALLLAACSSTSDSMTDSTGGAGSAGGLGGMSGIGSSDLGGSGSAMGNVGPGSQEDLEVNVGDRVFFAYDSSSIDDAARQTLDRQTAWLQQFPNVTVTIEGHADQRGTREYNLALGERRAAAAKNYLTASGVSSNRILTLSYGEERPLDDGQNDSAYALNRRAVTVVNVTN